MKGSNAVIDTIILIFVFIALETASLVLISNNSIVQKYSIMNGLRSVQSVFWKAGSNISGYFYLKKENGMLQAENLELRQQLTDLQTMRQFSDSAEIMPASVDFDIVQANIIKNSTNKQHNFLVLDKGSEDGIKEGMGVISSRGVVGVINAVSKKYSHVISLLNVSQSVSAKLTSSDYYGPLQWDGVSRNKAIMTDIPLSCNATAGDTVVTSGYSSIFPANIPIGIVTDTESVGGLFETLDVTLFQSYNTLHSVYVIINNNIDEIKDLEKRGIIHE